MAGSSFGGQAGGAGQATSQVVLPTIPKIPPEVIKAFPSMGQYQKDLEKFFEQLVNSIRKGG